MAAKRGNKSSGKTRPESAGSKSHRRPSGISAAAIEGAQQGEQSAAPDNAEKMERPGPGLTDPRSRRSKSGSMESTAAETSADSAERISEEDARKWRISEDASPDDFEEGAGDV
jgi:hypothetical protein